MIRLIVRGDNIGTVLDKKIDKAKQKTTADMNSRVAGLNRLFTHHIQKNITDGYAGVEGSFKGFSTGRLRNPNTKLVSLTSVKESRDRNVFFFGYTFPKNNGYEYGFAFGDKRNRLQRIDSIAKWVRNKGIFKYYKNGKALDITKPYQARSVALLMIRKLNNAERKYNVQDWYKIDISDKDVTDRLDKIRIELQSTFAENINKQ